MADETLSQSSSQHTSRLGNARFVPATAKPKTEEDPKRGEVFGGRNPNTELVQEHTQLCSVGSRDVTYLCPRVRLPS